MLSMPKPFHRIDKVQDLDELQQWMCSYLRTPMSAQDTVTPEPVYYLTPGKELSAKERLDIYVDDYWSRCFNSLAEDFPGLEHVWGHEKFHSMVEQYLVEHPSASYSLRNLGCKLWDFMQAKYEGKDKELVLDMIRFEWAKIEAFDNPVLPAFDPLKLRASQQKSLASVSWEFQPHLTLLKLSYPVYEVVDALLKTKRRSKNIPVPARKESCTVVYRSDLVVYHKEIDRPYYLLLERMKSGLSLEAACEQILPLLDAKEMNRLAKMAKLWFQGCVANKWLAAPKIVKAKPK